MTTGGFTARYWSSLTGPGVTSSVEGAGVRGRSGYTFWQRYWASLRGARLPVRQGGSASEAAESSKPMVWVARHRMGCAVGFAIVLGVLVLVVGSNVPRPLVDAPRAIEKSTGVVEATFSESGAVVVGTTAGSNAVQIWDAKTGQPVGGSLVGHTAAVTAVALSPDGRFVISASEDRTIRVWSLRTGGLMNVIVVGEVVRAVAIAPDSSTFVAAGGASLTLYGNPLGDVREMGRVALDQGRWTAVAFSSDGRMLAAGQQSGGIRILDVGDPAHPRYVEGGLPGGDGAVTAVGFSPDSSELVVGTTAGTVTLLERGVVGGYAWLGVLSVQDPGPVRSIVFPLGDNDVFAAGIGSRVWEIRKTVNPTRTDFRGEVKGSPFDRGVSSVAYTEDGNLVAVGGRQLQREPI